MKRQELTPFLFEILGRICTDLCFDIQQTLCRICGGHLKMHTTKNVTFNQPVLVLLSKLVVLEFLLLREGAPLRRQLLAELAEGDVGVLSPHVLAPLVEKMHVSAERLLRGSCSLEVK